MINIMSYTALLHNLCCLHGIFQNGVEIYVILQQNIQLFYFATKLGYSIYNEL